MSSVPLDAKWQPENHSCGIKHATLGVEDLAPNKSTGQRGKKDKKKKRKESEGRLMHLDLIDAKARHNWAQLRLQVETAGV